MSPTVAAVIPTVGRSELLRAVRSVHAQTYPAAAVVVVARPEAAPSVRKRLSDADLAAKVIVAERSLNGSQARNLGVNAAGSDIIAFLDDDDWWLADKVRRQVEALTAEPDRNAVCTTAAFLGGNEQEQGVRTVPRVPYRAGRVADYLLARHRPRYGHQFMQTSCLMGWRESFLGTPWDGSLLKHQDWDLLIRMIDRVGLRHVLITEPLTCVASDAAGSVSREPRWEQSLQWLQSVEVGRRSRNDFILSVAAPAALRAGSGAGLAACLKALAPALPRVGALAALANEILASAFPGTYARLRPAARRAHHG